MKGIWGKFKQLPDVLRRQVTIRCGLGTVILLLSIILWIITGEVILALPGLALTAFLLVSGILLGLRCLSDSYIRITGMVTTVELTSIRKKPKSLCLAVEGRTVQFPISQRIENITEGDHLTLYLSPATPIYEQEGTYRIFACLAIERPTKNH